MKNFKQIICLLILTSSLYANVPTFKVYNTSANNAQTVLITINTSNNIKDVKLSLNKLHLNFFKNPFKKNEYYSLLPLSYYKKIKEHRIIFSYVKEGKRIFTSEKIIITKGLYKKEIIKVNKKRVSLNKKDSKRANKEYKQATKIYKTVNKKILWQKDFILPLESKITSPFGTKRIYNGSLKSYHSGTDFKAPKNTKILASNAGKVVISQKRFYAGNSIVLDHGHGIYTGYYHLSTLEKKLGESVKRGELLGLSGSTGRVTGPHLHFSAKVHGITVDPLQLLKVLNILNN